MKGKIASPEWPLPYPNLSYCRISIEVPFGHQVKLTFTAFSLEDSQGCKKDSVMIRDGDMNGRLLGEFCSRDQPPVFFSTSRDLWVNFQSSPGSNPFRGFKAHYEVVSKLPLTASCNDAQRVTKIKGETGTLASYEYPLHYQNNVECVWILTSGSSKVIKLTFDMFDLESSAGCTADYVEVRDGNFVGDVIGRYCGQGGPGTVTSSESSMYIKFHSNGNVTAAGFMATY
ncbi:predicted protein, partial [Nematostella vectensis]